MNKIQKTSGRINKFLTVLFWLCAAAAVLAVVWTVVIYVGKGAICSELESVLILGDYKLTLADGFAMSDYPITLIQNIGVILAFAMVLLEIKVLKEIFTAMANGTPFQGSVSSSIRKLAWINLVYGAIGVAVKSITSTQLYRLLDVPSLFSPEKVSSCSLSIRSGAGFVIVFVVLILLSRVFEYGEELQQLSDETL